MDFFGTLKFEGAGIFRWVSKEEDGSVELVFDCQGRESTMKFSADAWAAIFKAAALLEAGQGRSISNPLEDRDGKGALKAEYLFINTVEEPVQFKVTDLNEQDLVNGTPVILITPPGKLDGIALCLSPKANKELQDRLGKALEIRSCIRALAKPRTIPAHA